MAKNHMNEVAQLLGVELNEEFRIKGKGKAKYKITRNCLITCNCKLSSGTDIWSASDELEGLLNGELTLEKPYLDIQEQNYLRAVVKPFKNKVSHIEKCCIDCDIEYIVIYIKTEPNICFPNFKANTMYKGMELHKRYTLEELGI